MQTDRLLTRAQERFAVQDYYGAVHLLEEIVAGGRSFSADVHHLLGVSLSMLGQSERALGEFARALELNPRYLEALIHQGVVLNELGREREADESFRRAAASVAPPSTGLPAHVAARRASSIPSSPPRTPKAAPRSAPSSSFGTLWTWALPSTICDTGWPVSCSVGPALEAKRSWSGCSGTPRLRGRGGRSRIGALSVGRCDRGPGSVEALPRPSSRERTGGGLPLDAGPNRRVRRALIACLALGIGCGGGDGERRADEAYAGGQYGGRFAIYRDLSAAGSEPRVLAKIGASALHAGRLGDVDRRVPQAGR